MDLKCRHSKLRVALWRIRLFPRLVSKREWIPYELPLKLGASNQVEPWTEGTGPTRGWIPKIFFVFEFKTPKINCHGMRTRINLRIGIILISGTIFEDTINGTFLNLTKVRSVWSWVRIPETILRHPFNFINSKRFLNSEMTWPSCFFSSTLNSRNFNVTLIQFNFWCTTGVQNEIR